MSPDERRLLTDLFERISSASANPRDRDAEAFISDAVRDMPYAPYLLAQAVLIQDEALKEAGKRIESLERDLAQREPETGSFLGGRDAIFGDRSATGEPVQSATGPWSHQRASVPSAGMPPRAAWGRQPYADNSTGFERRDAAPQPATPQQEGQGGFLKGALGAAAGVAGGVLLTNSLQGLFGGGHGGRGLLGGDATSKNSEAPAAASQGAGPDGNVDDGIAGGVFDKASHETEADPADDSGWGDADGDYDV